MHAILEIQSMFQLKRSSSKRGLKGGSSSSSTYGGPTFQAKALVVDDNPVNRKVLGKSLENLGVETREAKNGLEAIDLFFSTPTFDIIFMDRDMPIMDGLEAGLWGALGGLGVAASFSDV
ncbi:hypothetical protein Taro_043455 [Colocasia esculenta]|uniref:Response regulatory domain-containing protein n=1 Tax=Colocasia esculenta TaxID=4460 RepID=A0A843WYY7_COLES|nr:hypothetical protein [Colocasia esculenta]